MTVSGAPVIALEGLGKTYPGAKEAALEGVSLTVRHGEVVVLLGLSGSGKSTLLRLINGLEQPTTGSVRVLDHNVPALRGGQLRALRGRIGFVFQQFEIVGPITVLENVLTGALSRVSGPRLGVITYPKALRRKALEHLDRVGLLERAYQRADTLSGGQQQRVAIARALMQDPDLLLADEPVASLDPESSSQVMALIREIAAEAGLTVVCSLHQVEIALGWGDRIVGLQGGRVVLDTPAAGLDKQQVMEIYRKVATSSAEATAISDELAEARAELLTDELRRQREQEGETA